MQTHDPHGHRITPEQKMFAIVLCSPKQAMQFTNPRQLAQAM
jgi:hypothetical protein